MLSKTDSRERWRQIRALWNEWDPIGVTGGRVDDEYDGYLGPTLRLLESRASVEELQRYLAQVTLERMGLSESADAQASRLHFASRLLDWYESSWPGSQV
jgi:hypothetical protein